MPKKKGGKKNTTEAAPAEAPPAAVEEPEPEPEAAEKKWEPTRTDWRDPNSPPKPIPSTTADVSEATKHVNVEAAKGSLSVQAQALNADATRESKVLEDKLGNLKEQLSSLRSAIMSFETEFDQRLDACLQQIKNHKIGSESKPSPSKSVESRSPVKADA